MEEEAWGASNKEKGMKPVRRETTKLRSCLSVRMQRSELVTLSPL